MIVNKSLPYPDMHIHTHFCGHAQGTLEDTVRTAIEMGLSEIGFTGHFPYPSAYQGPVEDCVIPEDRFSDYINEVLRLKSKYTDQISIRLAAEVDYLDQYVEQSRSMLQVYPLDYVIGSIHIVEGVPIDYNEDLIRKNIHRLGGIDNMWEHYWHSMEGLVGSKLCQIIGHFDLPRKLRISQTQKSYNDRIENLLDQIMEQDLVLEVNTGGIDRSYDRKPYPSEWILRRALEKEIDITLGSDAHRPHEIGRHFGETTLFLKDLGFSRITTFENGEKKIHPL